MFRQCLRILPGIAALAVTGCLSSVGSSGKKLVLTGASTIAPLAAEMGKRFEESHPGVRVDVQTGGSSRGVADVRQGLNHIGMVSRPLKDDESDLHASPIARDGVSIILHKDNPVTALTNEQVIDIYKGKVTNWNAVGDRDARITVVNKAEGRSTLELFCAHFHLKNSDIKAHSVIGDNEQGIKQVAGNADAIGYVSIGTAEYDIAHGTPIKLLPIGGVAATSQNVANGKFPLARPLNLVTKAPPEGLAKEFIDFAQSDAVHDLIRGQSFVPLPKSDRPLLWVLRSCAAVAGAIQLLIVAFLILASVPALRHVGPSRFFTDLRWAPTAGEYDITPMLCGTLLITAGAVALATPLGVLSAVFLRFYAPPPVAWAYRRLVELLVGIPSVVYGFWGLITLVPLINRIRPPGTSVLAGVLVLALMIVPTVALMADAALASVPAQYLRGAAALGLSRWATVRGVALPAARSGLFAGVLLAIGRALGETMAVLMVSGNVVEIPSSLFDPARTLTANVALEMAFAMGHHRSALFVSGLLLAGLVVALVIGAETLARERAHV